jgi:Flp pilus assembly protein TadB
MFWLILISNLGFLCVVRILKISVQTGVISYDQMRQIVLFGAAIFTISFIFLLQITKLMATRYIATWILISLVILLIVGLVLVLAKFRERRLQQRFEPVITSILMRLKSGLGYRSAVAQELRNAQNISDILILRELEHQLNFRSEQFKKNQTVEWSETLVGLFDELKNIDLEPHLAVRKLEFLRSQIKRWSEFRRRIGQAKLQASLQSLVMICIYFAALIWMIYRGELTKSFLQISFSTLIFAVGAFWLNETGRKKKWKV